VKKKAQSTVLVKWVRSGIGFPRRQKVMVRSLGLRRLNQVVECPDTPQVRGLVAAVPHLVAIVSAPAAPAWAGVPEYRIKPVAIAPAKPVAPVAAEPVPAAVEESAPAETSSAPVEASSTEAEASSAPAEVAPKKRSRTKKSAASSKSVKPSEPDEK